MFVLFLSFVSKVRPSTVGCVAMGSAVLFYLRSILCRCYGDCHLRRS